MNQSQSNLAADYDPESVAALANAYEALVLQIASGSGATDHLARDTRTLIMRAMLREGRTNGFDPARMRQAAFAALGIHPRADHADEHHFSAV